MLVEVALGLVLLSIVGSELLVGAASAIEHLNRGATTAVAAGHVVDAAAIVLGEVGVLIEVLGRESAAVDCGIDMRAVALAHRAHCPSGGQFDLELAAVGLIEAHGRHLGAALVAPITREIHVVDGAHDCTAATIASFGLRKIARSAGGSPRGATTHAPL